VDIKEEQINDCTSFFKRIGINNVQFRVEDLLVRTHTNEFDLILAVDVREHIEEDRTVLQNFAAALNPGGFLLIHTPSDQGGSDTEASGEGGFIGEHARVGYGRHEIGEKLIAAGLTIERIRYTYGRLGMRAWRLGIKTPMRLLNIHKAFFVILPIYYLLILPVILPMMRADLDMENATGAGLLVLARKPHG